MSERADRVSLASEALARGVPFDALGPVRALIEADAAEAGPAELAEDLGLLARVGEALGDPELPGLLRAGLPRLDEVEVLVGLGRELAQRGLEDCAVALLGRAHARAPGDPAALGALAEALDGALRHAELRALLAEHRERVAGDFHLGQLAAWAALMTGDLEAVAAALPALRAQASGDVHRFRLGTLERPLLRAAALRGQTPLDLDDLRGWHWVLTGGLLGYRSPHGLEEGMRGRFAWLQDHPRLCRLGLERLADLVQAWERTPQAVVALPERGAEILAAALAARLDLPLQRWSGAAPERALLIAYDLSSLPEPVLRALLERRPGQLLWAHATRWTESFPITADVTTLLYQELVPPWGAQMVVNPQTGAVGRGAEDARPAAEQARELAALEVEDDAPPGDREALLRLARALGPDLIAASGASRREPMWAGSPVASNRFR